MLIGGVLLAVVALAVVAVSARSAVDVTGDPQLADIGFIGPSFAPAAAPTGDKPQSKLWFNDGSWWAVVFIERAGATVMAELDPVSHRWRTIDTVVDERVQAHLDVLWDGEILHVVSAGPDPDVLADSARYQRFSYDTGSRSYKRQDGFPVQLNVTGSESIVMTRDSLGSMWVTYTDDDSVWIAKSDETGKRWEPPFRLPSPQAVGLDPDDISTILAFDDSRRGPSVAVAFGNQANGTYTFVSHADDAPIDEWRTEILLEGPELADDHLNFKSATIDGEGWVAGVVKTSFNRPDDPLLLLLVRDPSGRWTTTTFGTVAEQHTRPTLLIDPEHRQVNVFASSPCCSGGAIYHKTTNIDAPQFPPGLGEVFIAFQGVSRLNNPTSMKQPVDSSTGLFVLAADVGEKLYAYNSVGLAPNDVPLDTSAPVRPSRVSTSGIERFRFVSTSPKATFECRLDGGPYTACAAELTLDDITDGPHELWVRAVDPSHPDVIDSTPAVIRWRRVRVLFADDFESGLGDWEVATNGGAEATTVADPAGSRGQIASFTSSGEPRTEAYAGHSFSAVSEVLVHADVNVTQGAEVGAHVRLLTLVDPEGEPIIYVYRQSDATDDGRIWLRAGSARRRTTIVLPIDSWVRIGLEVSIDDSGLATVRLTVDGDPVATDVSVTLDTNAIDRVQIGYPTSGQRYHVLVDALEVLG